MFVSVESGESGWGGYTLSIEKIREGAKLIKGDLSLGDAICRSTNYKSGQYFRLVISFAEDEGISPEKGRNITKELMKELMHGYSDDEYHLDIVEHTDTPKLHYHVRIPKLNLLTGTQLHYHYLSDIKRKDAIHMYLEAKHGLKSPFEEKKTRLNPNKRIEQINSWRADHNQKPFDLSTKKGRGEAEEMVSDYISEAVISGLLENLDEIKNELKTMGFDIVKVGHDIGKDFDYITIQNRTGKIRLKGDIYGREFYGHGREDRKKAIRSNKSFKARKRDDRGSFESARKELDRENRKRAKFLANRFGAARRRAEQKITENRRAERSKQAEIGGNIGKVGAKSGDREKQKNEEDRKQNLRDREGEPVEQITKPVEKVLENDRIRAEIARRDRENRERARERQDYLDARAKEDSERDQRRKHEREERAGRRRKQLEDIDRLDSTTTADDYRSIEEGIRYRQSCRTASTLIYRVFEWLKDSKSTISNGFKRGKRLANNVKQWAGIDGKKRKVKLEAQAKVEQEREIAEARVAKEEQEAKKIDLQFEKEEKTITRKRIIRPAFKP